MLYLRRLFFRKKSKGSITETITIFTVSILLILSIIFIASKFWKQNHVSEVINIAEMLPGKSEIEEKMTLRQNIPKITKKTLSPGCLDSVSEIDNGPHIVPPPEGPITLVCCQTTKGALNIAVHLQWAPLGAQNFLNMVETGFFSTQIGLFRALKSFLIQFGLAGDPEVQKKYELEVLKDEWLADDHQWLPEGPPGRNIKGVARFQEGYMSYAGAGKNSRG